MRDLSITHKCRHPMLWLDCIFVIWCNKTSLCTLFKARLHSPVDRIAAIAQNLNARDVQSTGGVIFLTSESGPIKAVQFDEGL